MRRHEGLVVLVLLAVALVGLLGSGPAQAHEFRPALLRLSERPSPAGAGQGAGDGSGAGDQSSGSFDLRLVTPRLSTAGPIPEGALTLIAPAHCERAVARLDCGARGLVGELGLAGLDRHPVDVLVEVRYVDGTRLTAVLGPDEPTLILDGAEPQGGSSASVFTDYAGLGVEHILIGLDHLLFVLGLVLLVRDTKTLLWTVTAFTLAHSVTLAASTLELLTLPGPPVEAGIALSILLLARELALGLDDESARDTWSWRYPWIVAFAFGLLHGFGFAGALADIGLPADQIALALLAFNVGVELGQLAVVLALLATLAGLRGLGRRVEASGRVGAWVQGAPARAVIWVMGALAFAWTLERILGFWG